MSEPTDLSASLARLQRAAHVRPVNDTDAELATIEAEWDARIPRRLRAARLDGVPSPARESIAQWLADGSPGSLVLLGPVGVGKTYAATAALRDAFEHGARVMFAPVAEALEALRPGGPTDAAQRLRSAGLLLLDDLGVEKPSEWTVERLDSIVNRRWLDEKPTIVTTNVAPERLEASVDPRLFSRLVHDALAIEMVGTDRRRT